jgi:hypothetical protein
MDEGHVSRTGLSQARVRRGPIIDVMRASCIPDRAHDRELPLQQYFVTPGMATGGTGSFMT